MSNIPPRKPTLLSSPLAEQDARYKVERKGKPRKELSDAWTHLEPELGEFIRQRRDSTSESAAQNVSCDMNEEPEDDRPLTLLLQPVTKRISQEQLRVELRSIYSGSVMVENKCKDVDTEQTRLATEGNPSCRPTLSSKQWQALIALHKTLLHEFHDFFLAIQHPAATSNLIGLATQNSMPARLWQFGIQNFLHVLRYRLPESLDYLLAFIYTSYSMMTLLHETVPIFADTWMECLGDLGRWRMAVEDDDKYNRETWSAVSQYWYKKTAENNPNVGRLAHHLAVLSKPFTLDQLSLYLRALISIEPYESAKSSVLTVLDSAIEGKQIREQSYTEMAFFKIIAMLFKKEQLERFPKALHEFKIALTAHLRKDKRDFTLQGASFVVCVAAGLYEFGRSEKNITLSLVRRVQENRRDGRISNAIEQGIEPTVLTDQLPNSHELPTALKGEVLFKENYEISLRSIKLASSVAFASFSIFLQFPDDVSVLPSVLEYFILIWEFIYHKDIMIIIEADIPWIRMGNFLNACSQSAANSEDDSMEFPQSERPLPEDYARRGLLYGRSYLPQKYLEDANLDTDEQGIEAASMALTRKERLRHLGHMISSSSQYLDYEPSLPGFRASSYAKRLAQRDILWVPEIKDIIDDSDSDVSSV